MATLSAAASGLSESEHNRQLRRAMLASTIGTTIEWYDFLLYGTVTGLVFGKVFFPGSSPLIGVLQAFGVFFIGFVGRPIGAAIFGHFGDRIGRKATLIATLLITGFATIAVGLVPGYASIGIWGAVLLTFIRLVQGIGVGGEWGGSVLPGKLGGPYFQLVVGRPVHGLGMAHPLPYQHRNGRRRSVDPAWDY
jgi:MFS family permease